MERENTCSPLPQGTLIPLGLVWQYSEGGKQSERACSYPLLTPELCIPEVLVLSPFAMGEADTEE